MLQLLLLLAGILAVGAFVLFVIFKVIALFFGERAAQIICASVGIIGMFGYLAFAIPKMWHTDGPWPVIIILVVCCALAYRK